MQKIKVIEAFAGYGSQAMALKRAGVNFKTVAIIENDKYASAAYNAVHGETPNFGDITKVNPKELPDCGLFTYSFPCTDVSIAGRGDGINENTRSGLLWHCERIIAEKLPETLLCENVKNLISKKHIGGFKKWCHRLESLGYRNYWQVMNAKDYGVPQNRERFFMVSIRGDHQSFIFPDQQPLDKKLCDTLEEHVDEKYFLSQKAIEGFLKHKDRHDKSGNNFGFKPHIDLDVVANCIGTGQNYRPTDNFIAVGVRQVGRNPENPKSRIAGLPTEQMLEFNNQPWSNCITTVQKDAMVGVIKIGNIHPSKRGMNGNVYRDRGLCPTITTNKGEGIKIMQGELLFIVRKLTPKECFRLMDVNDADFDKIKSALINKFYKGKDKANNQLYKMAGNSIVVACMEQIFTNLYVGVQNKKEYQTLLF